MVQAMKKITLHYIILSLLIGLVGTSMHFAHHLEVGDGVRDFFCHFFPIGETCWEHMKMIFFPMLLLAVIMCIKHKSIKDVGGPMLSATITIPIAIGLYFLFHIIAPEAELIADVVVYWAESWTNAVEYGACGRCGLPLLCFGWRPSLCSPAIIPTGTSSVCPTIGKPSTPTDTATRTTTRKSDITALHF